MKLALPVRISPSLYKIRYVLPVALGCLSLIMIQPALSQEQMMRTLTVTGEGEELIPATVARVNLGVEVQSRTAAEAQQEAARRSTAVVNLLRSRNVEKLQTTGINLSPRYDYSNNQQRLIGYTATNTVSFQVPTDRAGNIMDDAVGAGATRIDSISFIAEDAAITTAQRQALREATQDARTQAAAVLESLGLTPGEVVSIQVNGASAPTPPPMPLQRMEAAAANADFSTPVIGGEQEVRASVTLQIRY